MTALLLDTSSLFFRAHHALPPMSTAAGEPTSAIYGFASLILKLLREEKPTGVAFARDLAKPTLRHAQYADYKAGRPAMPDELRPQWKRLDQLLAALGAPSHAREGYEADDLLATLAATVEDDVVIVSGDRDLFQTISRRVKVLFVGARQKKAEKVDLDLVRRRYGIEPGQMPTWLALVGEAADNLHGVDGVGAKTATKLVASWKNAETMIANIDAITPPKTREAIRAAAERIVRNEALATLVTDLPLEEPLVRAIGPAELADARALFAELELESLVARLDDMKKANAQLTLF